METIPVRDGAERSSHTYHTPYRPGDFAVCRVNPKCSEWGEATSLAPPLGLTNPQFCTKHVLKHPLCHWGFLSFLLGHSRVLRALLGQCLQADSLGDLSGQPHSSPHSTDCRGCLPGRRPSPQLD